VKRSSVLRLAGLLAFAIAGDVLAGEAPGQPSGAADWPQWRGPNRNGAATAGPRLLDAWPEAGAKLMWQSQPIPGLPDGGPVGQGTQKGAASREP